MSSETQLEAIERIMGTSKGTKNHIGRKNAKQVDRHVWTINEELSVIDLYKTKPTDNEILEFSKGTELKLSSIKMKLSNIRYLDTGEGLKNVAETTKQLWKKAK